MDINEQTKISIHALRGEGDCNDDVTGKKIYDFNPRPPWGGRLILALNMFGLLLLFQSTPSVGRATGKTRGGKPKTNISIHALRGEGDIMRRLLRTPCLIFQSTPSVGRATQGSLCLPACNYYFNPRPPWGGRRDANQASTARQHFNPRPPWGGRPLCNLRYTVALQFQSTPSVGRATRHGLGLYIYAGISIHALRGEGDPARNGKI